MSDSLTPSPADERGAQGPTPAEDPTTPFETAPSQTTAFTGVSSEDDTVPFLESSGEIVASDSALAPPVAPANADPYAAAYVGDVTTVATTGPRTRWAGIIWGLVLATIAALCLWVALVPATRTAVADWWLAQTPMTGLAYGALALGAIAVLCAAVGLVGRAQRRRIASSAR